MPARVAILGGGVGGLSAAQELAERGFQVSVYEKQGVFGGKARSIPVPNSGLGGCKDLPGEHGFRFFPGFYKHIVDTMRRIPYGHNGNGVFDNLLEASRTEIARAGKPGVILPAHLPENPADWAAALRALFQSADLGLSDAEIMFFVDRLLVLLTSCEDRRVAEYEKIPWWDFIDAGNKSIAYQRFLAEGQTRSLVAMRAETSSTRTVGYILLQLYFGAFGTTAGFDRLLNGPTSDVWIDPWIAHLRTLGVDLQLNQATEKFRVAGGRIASVTVAGKEINADYYIAAMPVEIMTLLCSDELKAAAPSLANLHLLQTAWMNGIQFYLHQDISLTRGHTLYVDSPWALTSISQKQFWSGVDLAQFGDGRVGGILSVDISNWDTPGILYGKPASACSAEEIAAETWAQLKQHLNTGGSTQLDDGNLLSWFLDPDIRFPNSGEAVNAEPLMINNAGTLQYRPQAYTEIPNLFLASDYVQTYTDIACMEAANEAARRAVNSILNAAGLALPRCAIWPLQEPPVFKPLRDYDQLRFSLGLPHA